jgi:GYF domain 2
LTGFTMQAREALVAFVAVIMTAVIGAAVLLLASLRRRRRSKLASALNPGAAALSDDNWFVAKGDRQFGPITFDQLRSYAQDGLVARSDLLKRPGSPTWTRAQDVGGLFPRPSPHPNEPAVRGPADIALSPHDRVAAPPISEAQALRHLTADILRAGGRDIGMERPASDHSAPPISADRKRGNYFARHWRGELSLPVSYWINGILAGIATLSVNVGVHAATDFKDDFQPGIALATETLIWTMTSAITIWQLVGVWRSATNYRKELKIFWGPVAKVMVILGGALWVHDFAVTGAPQIEDLYDIYRGDAKMGTYAFRVLRDGRELEFSGGITFGAAKDLQRFLDAMPAVQVVHLNSPGGRTAEAARMAYLISVRKLATYVVGNCLSACTTIFLSGRERLISPQGRLGFHQPDAAGLTEQERRDIIAQSEMLLRQLGVSAAFAHKANLAPPDDMWFPSVAELISEHVATRVVNSLDFAMSDVDISDLSNEGIRNQLMNDPMYAQIRKYRPEQYARIVDTFEDALKRGVSGTELLEALKPPVTSTFFEMLPYAPDEDVLAVMHFFVTNASKMRASDPSDCYYSLRETEANQAMADRLRQKYPKRGERRVGDEAACHREFHRGPGPDTE